MTIHSIVRSKKSKILFAIVLGVLFLPHFSLADFTYVRTPSSFYAGVSSTITLDWTGGSPPDCYNLILRAGPDDVNGDSYYLATAQPFDLPRVFDVPEKLLVWKVDSEYYNITVDCNDLAFVTSQELEAEIVLSGQNTYVFSTFPTASASGGTSTLSSVTERCETIGNVTECYRSQDIYIGFLIEGLFVVIGILVIWFLFFRSS